MPHQAHCLPAFLPLSRSSLLSQMPPFDASHVERKSGFPNLTVLINKNVMRG